MIPRDALRPPSSDNPRLGAALSLAAFETGKAPATSTASSSGPAIAAITTSLTAAQGRAIRP